MSTNHLMHPRVAHNHAKNGYFPTDDATLYGIIDRLEAGSGSLRIFDPCCGEGDALAVLAKAFRQDKADCQTIGVELDAERAAATAKQLGFVVRGDIESCVLQSKSVGVLFLNPPYGFKTRDDLAGDKTPRWEEVFFNLTTHTLQDEGVLVLIVPTQSLTERFTAEIASRFTELRIWQAGVDTFNQVVIMGIKPKNRAAIGKKQLQMQQQQLADWQHATTITEFPGYCYAVPAASDRVFRPISLCVDKDGLAAELPALRGQTLWTQFGSLFNSHVVADKRRPLTRLGQWHSALALAAGQVNGVVESATGQRLLIKGSTHKTKLKTQEQQTDSKGNSVVVVTELDRFVPRIRAIDLTHGSDRYGEVVTIQ
ncbi:DUF6094 domain-containing protein [Stenoxybacter acetivorans]|uniref:DUF6094 domain-containing protein n=1 Tax=Stenoxybacter acetivorans TaxID=422441 RepID=UPI00055DB6D0|nr:DUF6094 domain-containing protein [Stenoxybacter acetivorans]